MTSPEPRIHGHGIGTAPLRAVDTFCRESGCSKSMLLSAAHRERAHAFFERSGYQGSTKRAFVRYRTAFDGDPAS